MRASKGFEECSHQMSAAISQALYFLYNILLGLEINEMFSPAIYRNVSFVSGV